MANPCPKCGNELRSDAKFCDSCGAPVEGAAPAAAVFADEPAAPASGINWKAIIIVVVLLGVLGWLLFGKSGTNGTLAGGGAGGDAANPHGGMDQGMGMEDVTNQIADAKASLEQNPLDVQSLATLYQMFGMIGRQSQLTPYVEKALTVLEEQKETLGPEKTEETLRGIVSAALSGGDAAGGVMALERYVEMDPENIQTFGMLGDLNYDLGDHDKAISWYTKYLEKADPAADAEAYWNARTDRASMYLARYDAKKDAADLDLALSELKVITKEQPSHWGAVFNLGQANLKAGFTAEAQAAFEQAKTLAGSPMEEWQAEVELAKMRGEEPPPPPGGDNPHGGTDMGATEGMPNPHGGSMGGAAEGMPNPHGDASGGSSESSPNPHGGTGGA